MGQFEHGFDGKVALITGGASGIGLATAKRLGSEGANVVIADIDEMRGKPVADEIGAEFRKLDVADSANWNDLVADVTSRHGGLHMVHLNAGVVTFPSTGEDLVGTFEIENLTDASYRRIMGANVDGVVFGTRATAAAIEKSGGGAIVVTASAASVIPFPPDPIYTLTKHAVAGFVRSLSPTLASKGITLAAVLPGVVDTNLLADGFADKAREMGIAVIPPEKIADGVVHAATSAPGGLWLCLAGAEPCAYEYAPVGDLGIPEEIEG